MKSTIYLLFIFLFNTVYGQNSLLKDSFNYEVKKVTGDLNKDKINDIVIVTQDTINDKSPYKLQIYFGQPNGELKLIITTVKAIEQQFPDGKEGYKTGNGFDGIAIKKGKFSISNQLLRGNFEHQFRFQNGNFELIGFSKVSSDGQGTITSIDFNLSTGLRIETRERYDTDKVLSRSKKKVVIRPLPKLQEFTPLENEWY
ncbi:hypothetical protein [Ferruginibacter sp.]|nr:hypothetical protein [Ferruginibacter sp.]